jgi:hypothetical protein
MVIKVFITYKCYLRLCGRSISVYVLFCCSTVVVIVVMWGNCATYPYMCCFVVPLW